MPERKKSSGTPGKRRLSLHGESESLDKKAKQEHFDTGDLAIREVYSSYADGDPPSTVSSSRFPQSISSFSSPSSTVDGDDRDRLQRFLPHPSNSIRDGSSSTVMSQHHPQTAGWSNIESGKSSLSTTSQSQSSSKSASRQQLTSNQFSQTAAALQQSSPPITFNLSTDQPLVNPPPKTQAAFVGKLYSMLEDEDIAKTGLIYWSAKGTTFTCPNPTEFSNIKRKSSRSSAPDGSNTVASPTDELPPNTSNPVKPVAGWMRDAVPVPYRMLSPPHIHGQPQKSATYPYSDGSTTRKDDGGLPARGITWDPFPAVQRMPPPLDNQIPIRYHPDPNRPPLSTQCFYRPGHTESPLYGPGHLPGAETLLNQMSALEDKVQKLTDVLNNDRIEHVRNNLDFTSYLLQMVGWAAGDQRDSPELRALQDTLSRQNAEMRHKYEAFMASDALAIMANGGGRERSDSRDITYERNARLGFEIPPFPGHSRTSVMDLHLPQSAQSSSLTLSQRAIPRSSPRSSMYSDPVLTRPSTGEPMREREVYPAYFPPQISHDSGAASSILPRGPETIAAPVYGDGPSVHPPLYGSAPIIEDHREVEKGGKHKDMDGPSMVELGRKEREKGDPRMAVVGDDAESKAGLRNLLN
ncbi:hypothetical protein D1P53_004629 [Cryptococcus gattii VGV]|nr:hypothetical protein D1P53_004629 [Cryptococcus gattii VGV]